MRAEVFIALFYLGVAGGVNIPIIPEVAALIVFVFALRVDESIDKLVVSLFMRKCNLVGDRLVINVPVPAQEPRFGSVVWDASQIGCLCRQWGGDW